MWHFEFKPSLYTLDIHEIRTHKQGSWKTWDGICSNTCVCYFNHAPENKLKSITMDTAFQ